MPDPHLLNNMINANVPSSKNENTSSILPLPLNLIALIISHLERSADLARMCRTCRVFHYMTLPQLYSNVALRSYDYIRYCEREGRPEGYGMASPFSMGLNGLVSRNVAGYVRNFELNGDWKEHDLQEHAKMGRVPDESMMLNSLVRVAVERMAVLDSFSWKLNTKMLPTIWQGLAQKTSLRKLTVKFPSERLPRPITLVSPIPNLEYLHIFDIDPLCYTDDISLLLLGSKKLRDLKLHWSPRMRETHEPSIHQAAYFGRCAAAQYPMPLRSIAIQNLYAQHGGNCAHILDLSKLEEITFLNSTGGLDDDNGAVAFMDGHWRKPDEVSPTRLKMARVDKVSRQQCEFLSNISGLEKLYLIGPHSRSRETHHHHQPNGSTPASALPHSPAASNYSSPGSTDINKLGTLKDAYIEAITRQHGPTLKHLLLLPHWRLTNDDIATIVRTCPNLTQLGVGVEAASFAHLRLLVPFLPNLTSLRILSNPEDPSFVETMREMDEKGLHVQKIGEDTVNREWSRLRYIELGADDLIFEIGEREVVVDDSKMENGVMVLDSDEMACPPGGSDMRVGTKKARWRRQVRKRSWGEVGHIGIWKMDSLDI